MKKDKRLSRCTALQILYSSEMSENLPAESFEFICKQFTDEKYSDRVKDYSLLLVHHTLENISYLDGLIRNKSKNWEIGRIAIIDNLILRMAIAEMLFIEDTPLKVSIAEAIEIAKIFSTKDSGRFVNGILDAIYQDIIKKNMVIN